MFNPARLDYVRSFEVTNVLYISSLILKNSGKQRQKKPNFTDEQKEGVVQCLFKNFKNNKPQCVQCAYISAKTISKI